MCASPGAITGERPGAVRRLEMRGGINRFSSRRWQPFGHRGEKIRDERDVTRVDWPVRDVAMRSAAAAAVARILERPKLARPTITAIARAIGPVDIMRGHADQLPTTRRYIERVVKTVAAYAWRRVRWTAAALMRERHIPTRWELYARAGIDSRRYADVADEMERVIQDFRGELRAAS